MKNIIMILLLIFLAKSATANNLNISSASFNSNDNTLSFTISWDNSWRITTGPSNWDAVWVFVKRQACTGNNIWAHQLLSSTSADHISTNASSTNLLTVDAVGDGLGVFIRRSALTTATGNISSHTIKLKINSTASGTAPNIATTATDNFKVMGLEMVYVPQGSFYLGDGRPTNTSNFSAGNNASTALLIDAAKQTNGLGSSNVYCSNSIYGSPGALPSTFPIGYNGFYCMKYELTTAAYVDFLNTLTYDQQEAKFTKRGNSNAHPNIADSYLSDGERAQIRIPSADIGIYNTKPAQFTFNTAVASYSACHYLNWQDLTAYLDWSGIRPMTEFEFEKASRGNNAGSPMLPIPFEYPWGSTVLTQMGYSNDRGAANERPNNIGANGLCAYGLNDYNWYPVRSGAASSATSNRVQSGATYYGIMEMGGNVWEQCVGGGSGYDYSGFTTANGDGKLTNNGLADVTGWPVNGGRNSGTIIRGSTYYRGETFLIQISDRTYYEGSDENISFYSGLGIGGRGVRSMAY